MNADTEYGPWPEWMKRVYYDCWNVTGLFHDASLRGEKAVAFGLRIGPGTYGHTGAQNFARGYNASALPLLFELRVESKSLSGDSSVHRTFASSAAGGGGGGGSSNNDGSALSVEPLEFSAHSDPILNSDWYSGETVWPR